MQIAQPRDLEGWGVKLSSDTKQANVR